MKLYIVRGAEGSTPKWFGTQADVAAEKRRLKDEGAKVRDISVLDVEVPTDKKGLLAFLNEGKY